MIKYYRIIFLLLLIITTQSCSDRLFSNYKVEGKTYEKINLSKLEDYKSQENKYFTRNTGYSNIDNSSESYILTSKKDTTVRIIVYKNNNVYQSIQKAKANKEFARITSFFPNGYFKSLEVGTKDNPVRYHLTSLLQKIPIEIAPDFKMKEVGGKDISLKDYRGFYIYITVWTTWDKNSREEIIAFNNLVKSYGDKNIIFINISIDKNDDYGKWSELVNEKNLLGIQLFAGEGWKSNFVKDYKINNVSRAILIDPSGIVLNSLAPRPTNPDIKEILNLIYEYGQKTLPNKSIK